MSKQNTENGVWILTKEYNDYNQYGDYIVSVFKSKPTLLELSKCLKYEESSEIIKRIFNGGGRRRFEYIWYNLGFVEYGKEEVKVDW